ncbi:MAG: c-type cytochrome [Spirulinaceae cyanobacterium RM2_2_10]|nr:c-type cytochrome [Spirulinaceae cyanobacterium SM2_1_0]NJO21449.1 c-type cytochrome [Spirulinaceae cyanobacterium RM2_2_10]
MKIFLTSLLVAVLSFAVLLVQPANAADTAKGAQIFSANCAACHAGGLNVVNSMKTLQKADLEKYGMDSVEAIAYQVTNGKAAMPAFRGRLTEEQIQDVASYVLEQAEQGW